MTSKRIDDRGVDAIHIDYGRPKYKRIFGDMTTSLATVLSSSVGSGVGFFIECLYVHNADSAARSVTWLLEDPGGVGQTLKHYSGIASLVDAAYPIFFIGSASLGNFQDRRFRFMKPGENLEVVTDAITTTACQYLIFYQEFSGIPENY